MSDKRMWCFYLTTNIITAHCQYFSDSINVAMRLYKDVWMNDWLSNSSLGDNLTSEASWNLISYMRMSPLGWCGSGQRRKTQSSWPSQVTEPGMSSAFSGETVDRTDYNGKFWSNHVSESMRFIHKRITSDPQVWFLRRRILQRCSAGPADCRHECRCGKLWTALTQRSAAHAQSLIAPWIQTPWMSSPQNLRCCCYQWLGEEGQCCCWCEAGCDVSE